MKSTDWQLDHYGVLSKLLFNESTQKVSEGVLRSLGFVHLYTASGIHLYALLETLEKVCARAIAFLGLRTYWVKRLALYSGMVLLAYLWHLQEYRLGFARPILIFLIRMWAREKGMRWRLLYPLFITFLLDWILQLESGRLHYYLAVGGGLLGMDWMKQKRKGLWAEHVMMALGSWFFTAAIDLAFNHTVAWMTPFWSLLTIPIISMILYPLSVLCWLTMHSIPDSIFIAWNTLLDTGVWITDQGFTFSIVAPSVICVSAVMALTAVYAASIYKTTGARAMITVIVLYLAWISPQSNERVVQLDVKQGDSMIVIKGGRVEMVDVGSSKALRPDQWMMKFAQHGVSKVDVILLSHFDEDHVGGLKNLVQWIPIGAIQTHQLHWQSLKGKKWVTRIHERAPIDLTSENRLKLMKLSWFRSDSKRTDGNSFMSGVVLPLDEHRAYFGLGDGDESQETAYIDFFRPDLDQYAYKIWKAGHHGSKFSSGETQMQTLKPSLVWVSVGKKNQYHHPAFEAMVRLRHLGVSIQRTDEAGDLTEKISQSFFAKISG
jgi:beta-lactamase superfamily II metal-dependent hydrolase